MTDTMPTKQQKTPPAAEMHPMDVYHTVYTTDEQLREYCERSKEEINVNFPIFRRRLPKLMKEHKGEFVLMRNGRMLGFFKDENKAYTEGNRRFNDCVFNVLKVRDRVVDLGIFSRV